MKNLIITSLLFFSTSSFAYTQAEAVKAVFSNDQFIASIGESSIKSISVNDDGRDFTVVVNEKAPLADGCKFIAVVSAVRFATGPSSTGSRLEVSSQDRVCGW